MLLVAYKKKRRRRKIGETEKENEQLSDFWQLPMSAVTTYLLYPNRQIPQVLGRYTFLIITKHLAKCASYWQMTILKWFVLCEWRNAPAMITSASNMADQQHEPVFVTACVCHSLCLSLPVFVTSCVCHSLCLSLPVFVTACVCHHLCLSLLVLVTACACHSLSASFVSHFARHYYIRVAVKRVTGGGSIPWTKRTRDLWKIHPKREESEDKLWKEGMELWGKRVSLSDRNLCLLRDQNE